LNASALLLTAAPAQGLAPAAGTGPGVAGALLALALVLGLIFGLSWLLKRMPGAGAGGLRPSAQLRLVAAIPVGTKERVMVIQVGDEQLLIGVAAGAVSVLHHLPQPLQAEAPPPLPDFGAMLARLRKGR